MKNFSAKVAGIGLVTTMAFAIGANKAQAFDFTFSFDDDSSDNIFDKSHISGTVTGTLKGLSDNLDNQQPSEVVITSFPSGLGLNPGSFTLTGFTGSGVDVSGGQITNIDLFKNFGNLNGGFGDFGTGCDVCQFRLNNDLGFNLLFNNDLDPDVVTGNIGGFGGASYAAIPTPVPFGVSTDLSILVLGGLYGASRLRKTLTARSK